MAYSQQPASPYGTVPSWLWSAHCQYETKLEPQLINGITVPIYRELWLASLDDLHWDVNRIPSY